MFRYLIVVLCVFLAAPMGAIARSHATSGVGSLPGPLVRLPGHVLPALAQATVVPSGKAKGNEPLTLTLVLKRDDQAGFERYLHDVYDPQSKVYRHFLSQREIAEKFGPSRDAYDLVLRYLKKNGFELVEDSANRLTLTVRGTRAKIERAFDLHIGDYKIGNTTFYANNTDPALPKPVASHVGSVSGLSNLAAPSRPLSTSASLDVSTAAAPNVQHTITVCGLAGSQLTPLGASTSVGEALLGFGVNVSGPVASGFKFICGTYLVATGWALITCDIWGLFDSTVWTFHPQCAEFASAGAGVTASLGTDKPKFANLFPFMLSSLGIADARAAVPSVNAQKIGLLEFDTFKRSDVANWLAAFGKETALVKLSDVPVNGGVAVPGAEEAEVLVDIDTVMLLASVPDISYVVYHAPPGTSFEAMFNAMINDGVTVISNSWSQCENQTTLAQAQSIDSILQQAAAQGISVFNASGDAGSTCLNGSPNTIGVPADSPNATAVGGSSPSLGPGLTYGNEKWWDGTNDTPPSGQGGYGVSKFFSRPLYQDGLTGSTMRSIPDVVADADPANGIQICQASAGGCPSGLYFGGTSVAAPQWAAYAANLNRMLGANIGNANAKLYPLAGTGAFHTAASMGSDFEHVGLGSPDLPRLRLALSGLTVGPVSASLSMVGALGPNPDRTVSADGESVGIVQTTLMDASAFPVSGKTVSLAVNAGSHATIIQLSGVSDSDGNVVFKIKNSTVEQVTFTVTDTTDGIVLNQKPSIDFGVPPAASAGINAFPTPVTADGVSATTITLTLQDALGRPTPGKLVTLAQSGNSVISGPVPPVTDVNGQIQFTAVDQLPETVTYTATDVTDGNLAFPSTGTVTFSGGIANGCGNGNPIAAPGFLVTPYATGFVAQNFFFGNINFGGCPGAVGMAFDGSGNLYVTEAPTGKIYKFPPGGGVANSTTVLPSTPIGPAVLGLTFDKSGNLFAGRHATTGNFTTGAVLQINPSTGAVVRTVASGLTCPGFISLDPLSGDLFAGDACSGGGSDNPSLWRIANPGSLSPTTSVYATLPGTPNATVAFAPSGTLYVWGVTGSSAQVLKVSGTNGPSTPTISIVPGLSVTNLGLLAEGMQPNGDANFLVLNFPVQGNPALGNSMGIADLTSNPPSLSTTLIANGSANALIVGPDGCIYASQGTAVFRITDTSGACQYNASTPAPTLALSPTVISPNPAQGTSQSFTAGLHYVAAPAGTAVFFQVSGTNSQVKMVRTDANGHASFAYVAVNAGKDTIVASATINTTVVTSNPVPVTWTAGKHVTFLTLNLSPQGATVGVPVTLIASLTDISAQPPVPLPGESITLDLGGNSCFATSDQAGIASCQITPQLVGPGTLTASFTGTAGFVASHDSAGFNVMAAPAANIPPVANAGSNQTDRQGSLVTLNGSASHDPDGGPSPLAYQWTQATGPSANLTAANTVTPKFVAATAGQYGFNLVVNDDAANSPTSSVTITVPLLGDINLDGDVDTDDLKLITSVLNKPANGPNDLRDLNGDMQINVLDARKLALLCTSPRCAVR